MEDENAICKSHFSPDNGPILDNKQMLPFYKHAITMTNQPESVYSFGWALVVGNDE